VTLTVDPNPVEPGSAAILSVDSRLPVGLVDGVATWWQCWNGTMWIDIYLVERDYGNGPTTLKIEAGATTTIPALGLSVPNSAAIIVPDVAPGLYRIRDELVSQGSETIAGFVLVEVVSGHTSGEGGTAGDG
jgi:hypothetical protein